MWGSEQCAMVNMLLLSLSHCVLLPIPLALSLTHTVSHPHCVSPTLSLTHPVSHPHCVSPTLSLSRPVSHPHCLSPTLCPSHIAAKSGHICALVYLMKSSPELVEARDDHGGTLAHSAARGGHVHVRLNSQSCALFLTLSLGVSKSSGLNRLPKRQFNLCLRLSLCVSKLNFQVKLHTYVAQQD